MFETIFENLDSWIAAQNREARREGYLEIEKCEFWIVGQVAIMQANLDIYVGETTDLDAFSNANFPVLAELAKLLAVHGLELEKLPDQIWMPEETSYIDFYTISTQVC